MTRTWLVVIFCLVILKDAYCSTANPLEGLIQLTNMNHDHYFAEYKYILAYVDDLSKGCKKCKTAKKILLDTLPTIPKRFEFKLAYINRKTDSALLKKLKLFENRKFAYLANNRAVPYRENVWNTKSLSKWIKKRIIKPSHTFELETDFEGHEKSHPRVVTYAGLRNKYYNIFRYIASSYEDIHFLHSFSTPVLNRRNRTIEFTKNPEKTSFTIHVPFTSQDLNTLIETHNNVQRILDVVTLERIMTKEDLTFLLIHTDPSSADVTRFFRTGLKMYDKALFIATPIVEGKFMRKIIRWLGVGPQHGKPFPVLRLIAREHNRMKKYEFTGSKITEESILKFYDDYKSGLLKPYYLSESAPASQSTSVKQVVGTTFDEVVGNKLKDVIVFFHSVWCLECKDIRPLFESLAANFGGFDDIQFVTVDSYNNEGDKIPDGTTGEAIVSLFKAEDKKHPIKFKGKWMLTDLQKWLEKSLSIKLDL